MEFYSYEYFIQLLSFSIPSEGGLGLQGIDSMNGTEINLKALYYLL